MNFYMLTFLYVNMWKFMVIKKIFLFIFPKNRIFQSYLFLIFFINIRWQNSFYSINNKSRKKTFGILYCSEKLWNYHCFWNQNSRFSFRSSRAVVSSRQLPSSSSVIQSLVVSSPRIQSPRFCAVLAGQFPKE